MGECFFAGFRPGHSRFSKKDGYLQGKDRQKFVPLESAVHIQSCHIQVHKDKMADASTHDKEMEYLMGAEGLVLCIEDGKL